MWHDMLVCILLLLHDIVLLFERSATGWWWLYCDERTEWNGTCGAWSIPHNGWIDNGDSDKMLRGSIQQQKKPANNTTWFASCRCGMLPISSQIVRCIWAVDRRCDTSLNLSDLQSFFILIHRCLERWYAHHHIEHMFRICFDPFANQPIGKRYILFDLLWTFPRICIHHISTYKHFFIPEYVKLKSNFHQHNDINPTSDKTMLFPVPHCDAILIVDLINQLNLIRVCLSPNIVASHVNTFETFENFLQ